MRHHHHFAQGGATASSRYTQCSVGIGVRGGAPDVDKGGFGGAAPEENFAPGRYLALEVAAGASGGVFAVTAVASVIIFGSRGIIPPIDGILLPSLP